MSLITRQWWVIVGAFYRMGEAGCTAATKYIRAVALCSPSAMTPSSFLSHLQRARQFLERYGRVVANRNKYQHFLLLHESQALFRFAFPGDIDGIWSRRVGAKFDRADTCDLIAPAFTRLRLD